MAMWNPYEATPNITLLCTGNVRQIHTEYGFRKYYGRIRGNNCM